MGILDFSQCDWNVCVNMKAIAYKLLSAAHAHCLQFTPVDRDRVSQGRLSSLLAEIWAVSGEISVKRAGPLHT